jgi:hypothetical protein
MDIASKLNQVLTYWAPSTPNGFGGWNYALPVEKACRWDERLRVTVDAQGREVVSTASAYVLEELSLEGYIRLGSLSSNMPNPTEDKDARRILSRAKTPSIDASEHVYQVFV